MSFNCPKHPDFSLSPLHLSCSDPSSVGSRIVFSSTGGATSSESLTGAKSDLPGMYWMMDAGYGNHGKFQVVDDGDPR